MIQTRGQLRYACHMMRTLTWLGAVGLIAVGCDPIEDPDDGAVGTSAVDGAADGNADADGGADGGDDPLGAVAAHNLIRANAQPAPDPALPDLVWDSNLASIATQWAEGCVFEHSGNEFGENLYVGSGTPDAATAIVAWGDEDAMYDYASNGCSGVCGHYTQIVWRDTTRVGCGFADCDSVAGVDFAGRIWVCNYDPPGNFVGQQPY